MRNPEGLFELEPDVPDVGGAVLLHEFRGFMDAGQAGQGVTEHLLTEMDHQVIARFDMDQLIDYRGRRPVMTFANNRWEHYEAPELVVYALRDDSSVPFLLLSGDEPDLQWERFAAAIVSLVEQLGVRLSIGLHGIPMGAPHTRPLGLTSHATRRELLPAEADTINRLKVPGNVAGLVEIRLGEAGHDAMGCAVHVPHYVAQGAYPAASVRLLEAVGQVSGLVLPDENLRQAGRDIDAEVDSQVENSEEVSEVVRALEEQYDMFSEGNEERSLLADSPAELPSGDELGAELERFLAEQRQHPDM